MGTALVPVTTASVPFLPLGEVLSDVNEEGCVLVAQMGVMHRVGFDFEEGCDGGGFFGGYRESGLNVLIIDLPGNLAGVRGFFGRLI